MSSLRTGQLPYFPSAEAPAPSPKGGRHHHHHPSHPPTQPPAKQPPTHPPAKQPPIHPPVNPPTHPPSYPPTRKYVAVQGVVYCKSCQFKGIDTLMGASPLPGELELLTYFSHVLTVTLNVIYMYSCSIIRLKTPKRA